VRGEFEEMSVNPVGMNAADGFRDARVQPHAITRRETVENALMRGRRDEAMSPRTAVGLDEGQPAGFAQQIEAFQRCAVDDGREHVNVESASDDSGYAKEVGALG
jgi:hypothetical protein